MEGRWAKLMLYAHLHKYIDTHKPIHPVIEELIFRYITAKEELSISNISPTLDEQGDLLYISEKWITQQKGYILPIHKDTIKELDTSKDEQSSENALIKQWKILNKQGNK